MGQIEEIIGLIRGEQIEGGNTKERVSEVLTLIAEEIAKKIDKEEGKGLSSNDFTDEDKDDLRLALKNGFKEIRCITTDSGDFNIVIKVNKGRVAMTYNLATNHNVALKKYADEQFRLLEERLKQN